MAKTTEALAIGIGPQSDQASVNTDVSGATELIDTVASPSGATGIFIRNNEDLAKSFNRIESDGGRAPGSLTRKSGVLTRVEPAVTFTIDLMGNLVTTTAGTPLDDEYDFAEYFEQILAGARLDKADGTQPVTTYEFATDDTAAYKTVKIWRGLTDTESWTLVGCTFNLTFNHVAGEKSTVDVECVADSVIYDTTDTFPPNVAPATQDLSAAFGNQTLAAPILQLADAALDGVTRGFQSASLGLSYEVIETPDSNVTNGIIKTQGTRNVTFTADWFHDTGETTGDYPNLETDLTQSGAAVPQVLYRVGQTSGAAEDPNAVLFLIPSLRYETTDKVDGEQVIRTISGYATISGTTGFGDGANEELRISAV